MWCNFTVDIIPVIWNSLVFFHMWLFSAFHSLLLFVPNTYNIFPPTALYSFFTSLSWPPMSPKKVLAITPFYCWVKLSYWLASWSALQSVRQSTPSHDPLSAPYKGHHIISILSPWSSHCSIHQNTLNFLSLCSPFLRADPLYWTSAVTT